MAFVGLDGCRTGWVGVSIGTHSQEIFHLRKIDELDLLSFDRAAIDIPIGLPETGHRCCDLKAKKPLGRKSARVFTGARRSVLRHYRNGITRSKASRDLKRSGDHGISCQLWCLMPKIDEVDSFVCKRKSIVQLVESHPELVFFRLNQDKPVEASKKTKEGQEIRRALLSKNGFKNADLDNWLDEWRMGLGVAADDVLDACACAIAARSYDRGHCLPSQALPDDCGITMQIWY